MTKFEMIRELIRNSSFGFSDRGVVYRYAMHRKKENISNCYESYKREKVSANFALSVLTGLFPNKK